MEYLPQFPHSFPYTYQLRARRALSQFANVPLRTRRVLSLYEVYGNSTLLVLSWQCDNYFHQIIVIFQLCFQLPSFSPVSPSFPFSFTHHILSCYFPKSFTQSSVLLFPFLTSFIQYLWFSFYFLLFIFSSFSHLLFFLLSPIVFLFTCFLSFFFVLIFVFSSFSFSNYSFYLFYVSYPPLLFFFMQTEWINRTQYQLLLAIPYQMYRINDVPLGKRQEGTQNITKLLVISHLIVGSLMVKLHLITTQYARIVWNLVHSWTNKMKSTTYNCHFKVSVVLWKSINLYQQASRFHINLAKSTRNGKNQ